MSSPLTLWTHFFKACHLPSAVAATYATNFVRERIQPAMLKDLSKAELKELGVETVGDQLAILKHIKESDGVPPELSDELPSRKIVLNGSSSSSDVMMDDIPPPPSRRGKPAPDRHEVYRVVMPEGRTQRTKAILERHGELRERGLITRGTTGVRVAGKSFERVSNESRVIRKPIATTSRIRSDFDEEGESRRRILPPARPINEAGASRFASAVGIGRDRVRPRISFDENGPVRVVRRVFDDAVREREPVKVIRRVRYV
uniref:SAM domain-containing protein n=1 Tax=Panagrolaimus sp. JU765 TaxID=591449 RepID=A0AC34Q2Q0_9BILA